LVSGSDFYIQQREAASVIIATNGADRATIDSAGNLGLGVTPSAWSSSFKAIETQGGSFVGASSTAIEFWCNSYYNGTSSLYKNTGFAAVYNMGSGSHKWYTAASGTAGNAISFTQAMTLDANGNLGVGTTSPAAKFQTQQTSAGSRVTGALLQNVGSSASTAVSLDFAPHESSASPTTLARIDAIRTQTSNALTDLVFSTFNATLQERARIDSSGNLLVGTTSASAGNTFGNGILARSSNKPLAAVCDASSGNSSMGMGRTTSTGNYVEFYYGSGLTTNTGTISTNGTTTAYNTTSDQRLKENIVDAPDFGSVIDSIQVRSFNWKTDQTHQRAGFIAQELITVAPEAVHQPEDTEQMMAVDYSKLVPMLVKEIQSLRQRLAAANL